MQQKIRAVDGTLKIVPITQTNPLKSPGNFLQHEWGLIQDCENNNSDEDAWVDVNHNEFPGYNDPLSSNYPAALVQLQDWNANWKKDKDDPKFRSFDPCEALSNSFKRPSWM